MFSRKEIHRPLDVPYSNTTADMCFSRLNPDLSKQVHHTLTEKKEKNNLLGKSNHCNYVEIGKENIKIENLKFKHL